MNTITPHHNQYFVVTIEQTVHIHTEERHDDILTIVHFGHVERTEIYRGHNSFMKNIKALQKTKNKAITGQKREKDKP